jgi:hypothetical protein
MATFGVTIATASGAIFESVDLEKKADFKQLIDSTGAHAQAITYDTSYSFSARGKGDSNPYGAGISSNLPTGASGKMIVTSSKESSKNDDYLAWEMSATIYPHAT